jgi:tRNA pseudouridine55 synthase
VSAVKVGGKRLYDLARAGLDVERAARQVVVHSIELGELGETHADLVVRCGRGCYVRSIAHELGEALGVPAHLESLRRTAVGAFTASRAVTLDEIRLAVSAAEDVAVPAATLRLAAATLAVSDALGFLPVLRVRREAETRVRNGAQPTAQMLRETPRAVGLHRLQSEDGRWLFGIARGPAARLELVFQDPLPVPAGETEPA